MVFLRDMKSYEGDLSYGRIGGMPNLRGFHLYRKLPIFGVTRCRHINIVIPVSLITSSIYFVSRHTYKENLQQGLIFCV